MTTKIKLLKIETIAKETFSFHFEKPADWKFIPGQFVQLKIMVNGTEQDHYFSITTSNDDTEIGFATRNTKSEYKLALLALTPGSEVTIDGPMGQFIFDATFEGDSVFLTGGIGVTPCRSMLREMQVKEFKKRIIMFFSNRTPADAPFLDELSKISDPNFKLICTMTDEVPDWTGEKGYFSELLLKKYLVAPQNCKYYIVGPPSLVQKTLELLDSMNIPKENIKTEQFTGYN